MDTGEKIGLAAVMPVYNQAETIEKVIETWIQRLTTLGTPFQLHVYNDGSTDGTPATLNRLADTHPALRVHHKINTGHGPTILQGYLDNLHAEWIFQVDSDDEVSADTFEAFWKQRDTYDFVIANRTDRHATFSRKLLSRSARAMIYRLCGRSIGDVNAPYRLMRSVIFAPCFRAIPKNTFAPNLLVIAYAISQDVRMIEIDVPHQRPITGSVSTSSLRIVKGAVLSLGQVLAFHFGQTRSTRAQTPKP